MDQKHSRLGIASFAISIVFGALLFVLLVIAGFIEVTTPGGMVDSSPAAVMIGLALFGLLAIAFVGVGLGIAGLFQQDRRKLFSILGISFSVAAVLAVVILYIIGSKA